jgi:hypothetical protein
MAGAEVAFPSLAGLGTQDDITEALVPSDKPTRGQIIELMKLRLSTLGLAREAAMTLAAHAEGSSCADIARL